MSSAALKHAGLRKHDWQVEQLVSDFSLRNACVLYRYSGRRLHTQYVSLEDEVAVIHGFSEFRFGFIRLASVRAPVSVAERKTLRAECPSHPVGFALPFTANNIYHALFHAVPAFEAFARYEVASPLSFLPLLANSAGVGRKISSAGNWHAWELSLRALTNSSGAEITAALNDTLRRPCTCFTRIFGSSAAFTPSAGSSARRLRAWRAAVLQRVDHLLAGSVFGLGPFMQSRGDLIIYARRTRTRVIVNEADLAAILAPTRPIQLDEISLSKQLALLSTVRGLVGVHGQALAFLPFLGARHHRHASASGAASACGVLEILPPPTDGGTCGVGVACDTTNHFKHLYREMAQTMGISYLAVVSRLAPPCAHDVTLRRVRLEERLRCNLTVPAARLAYGMRKLTSMLRT